MRKNNSTFRGAEPTWANACVGDNGEPGYIEYSKGFSQAAYLLIDIVLDNKGIEYPVDDLVYPVCFNMRHSVELRLKGAIEVLQQIAKIKGSGLIFNLSGSHDIKNIWTVFKTESEKIDSRYVAINKKIEPTILDIAEVDATGQTFRYPVNKESKKHLTDIALINFVVLKKKFNVLEEGLDILQRLNIYLHEEYSHGTFTKNLSRLELFKLSEILPQKNSWSDIDFNKVKNQIKEAYKLSSNDLSKAINIIKDHFEMAPNIGESPRLLGVLENQIIIFFDEWIKLHERVKQRSSRHISFKPNDMELLFDEMAKNSEIIADSWDVISVSLTAEFLAGLKALFYFARYKDFSETYVHLYNNFIKEDILAFAGQENDLKISFMHLFNKTNAIENVLISLYFLNKNSFADQMVERYSLNKSFTWLEKARSRELFKKENYCGY